MGLTLRHSCCATRCGCGGQSYLYQLLKGLDACHRRGIMHRDLKPANILLHNDQVKLADFGFCRMLNGPKDMAKTLVGSPIYMAPEVLNRQRHSIAVDYFALGVIAYEFMTGRRPYLGRNRKEIKECIISRQVRLVKTQVPAGWSMESADFINKLLERNPDNRLGCNGPSEVKNHV